mmetsp:Transcript_67793/g.78775  ORF Transcript_67793/g.78775 Transcript_67793/m.78775 type:complete len:96 (-) Transcript_67793:11-298(-)
MKEKAQLSFLCIEAAENASNASNGLEQRNKWSEGGPYATVTADVQQVQPMMIRMMLHNTIHSRRCHDVQEELMLRGNVPRVIFIWVLVNVSLSLQ